MRYINDISDISLSNTCVTVGKFDGLHIGHQLLFSKLEEYRAKGLTTVVFTFDMQPDTVISDSNVEPVYTKEKKLELLSKRGPDVLIEYPFTRETAEMTAEDFVRNILLARLGMKVIVVGDDFRFGRNRAGDIALLQKLGREEGFETVVIRRRKLGEETVSSSLIRAALSHEDRELAKEMLGADFFDEKG